MANYLLTLGDLELVLRDLLGKRADSLALLHSRATYEPLLRRALSAVEALPPAQKKALPLAVELADQDAIHDGLGAAIFHYTQAVLRSPLVTLEDKQAAERIGAAFAPSLGELRSPYRTEASRAQHRQAELPRLAADLERFPVPGGASGGHLGGWASAFVEAGLALLPLLSARADARQSGKASPEQLSAGALRGQVLGLLGRLRQAVHDELEAEMERPTGQRHLPVDLDVRLFATFDELSRAVGDGPAGKEPSGGSGQAGGGAPPASKG